jgi:hypothetical protein
MPYASAHCRRLHLRLDALNLLIAAGLPAAGVVTWADVADSIRARPARGSISMNASRNQGLGRGALCAAREPPNRSLSALDSRLLGQRAPESADGLWKGRAELVDRLEV